MNDIIYLNGVWQFCCKEDGIWKEGLVPGCVQTDLMRLGELDDLYYGLNDSLSFELEDKKWIYKREFDFNIKKEDYLYIYLTFEGVDTLTDIYLNGAFIGSTENMLISHRFDIKNLVREGRNIIEVHFDSAIRAARALKAADTVDLRYCCEPAAPYVRKAHYSFGWDWSPRILQVGIWRAVHIDLIEKAEIVNPFFHTYELTNDIARVSVEAEVMSPAAEQLEACIAIYFDDEIKALKSVPVVKVRDGFGVSTEFMIPNPSLWFPNGLGNQPLYRICIQLFQEGTVLTEHVFRSGIRIVKLIREKDPEGESFIFEINGCKVFAKGANWVPADNLLPKITKEDYHFYVKAAKEANFNMFMLWGGGIYEDPAFYEACDEMGIMIWQTFMNHYIQFPDHLEWFQNLIAKEAESVIKRLRNHSSIVLWCGECENGWFFDRKTKYKGNYTVDDIFPKMVAKFDPSRQYRRGTPWGGEDANSMSEGDRHSWDVWLNWQDYGQYLNDTARFVTEFGASSMPNWKTVLSYTSSEELSLLSNTTINHCKLPEGIDRLIRFMAGRLGFARDFRSFCYLSQFNQAEAIKTAVEHWRSRKFKTSGTLFWMYNDCWPTISWSCIDYYKRKKGLYFYARNFYAEILPLIKYEDNNVYMDIVNDLPEEINAETRISAYKFDGTKLSEKRFQVCAAANTVTRIKSFDIAELGIGNTPRQQVVDRIFTVISEKVNGELMDTVLFIELIAGGNIYKNYLVFDRFRSLKLNNPDIKIDIKENIILMTADVPVFGLFIETEKDVELSDNCLTLEPGLVYKVECSDSPGNVEILNLADLRMEFR